MNFLEMQDSVMRSLNLSSTEARTRVKALLNLRNREITSGVGLGKVRRSTVTANTVANNNQITFPNVANVMSVFDAVNLKRPLGEVTVDEIRAMDPAAAVNGYPHCYAVYKHLVDSVILLLYPEPSTVYALSADVLALGVEMSADADEPPFPEDFHDTLVHGVRAEELLKMEKSQHLQVEAERRFEKRLSELRYFLAKRARLHQAPKDRYPGLTPRIWPIGV